MKSGVGLLQCVVPVKDQEVESVLYSFCALFSILTSYFLLLPLREDAGLALGTSTLPLLFACSLLVTLVATPAVTAYLNSKGHAQGRDAALRQFYRAMAAILLGFFVLYNFSLVESWVDRFIVTHPRLHSAAQHSAAQHPVDALLQQRGAFQQQQQHGAFQQQQQQPGTATHPTAVHMLQEQQASLDVHKQQQQQDRRSLRHLLIHEEGSDTEELAKATAAVTLSALRHHHSSNHHNSHHHSSSSSHKGAHSHGSGHAGHSSGHSGFGSSGGGGGADSSGRSDSDAGRSDSDAGSSGSSDDAGSEEGSNSSDAAAPGAVSSRTGDPALSKHQRRLRAAFYVWVQVMNLVGISSLWAKCADAFSPEAGARLFGFISAGATLGQLAGSLIAMAASWVAGTMLSRVQAGMVTSSHDSSGGGGSSGMLPGAGSEVQQASGRAAPPASSLLLLAAILQLSAAHLVTRIKPVPSAAGGAGPAGSVAAKAAATLSSSSKGGERQLPQVLTHRSVSTEPTAEASSKNQHSSSCNGNGNVTALTDVRSPSRSKPPGLGPVRAAAAAAAAVLGGLGRRRSSFLGGPVDNRPSAGQVLHSKGSPEATTGSNSSSGAAAAGSGGKGGSSSGRDSPGNKPGFQLSKVLTGFQLIWNSPYLLMLCSNLLLTYVVGSLMYFQRALVVSAAAAVHGPAYRTAFFATLNTWSAAAILLMQLFATSSLLRWMGMSAALAIGPAICLAGLLSIASCPLPWMVAVSEVARKIFGYSVLRPAREVLFTVVSREEKYSAKLVIDTVVQRLGDALAAAVFQVLDVQYSLGQVGVGAAGCVMCVVWLVTALLLGRKHRQLAHRAGPMQF